MNAHKLRLSIVWPKDGPGVVWTLVLALISALVLAFSTVSMRAQAAPCFDSPARAYAYLLAQDKLELQAQTQFSININRAAEGELVSLNGIGSSKAQAIILYREMFGDFERVEDLAKVKGIGAKTIEKNRSRLRVQN